jgi:hypothetical protein
LVSNFQELVVWPYLVEVLHASFLEVAAHASAANAHAADILQLAHDQQVATLCATKREEGSATLSSFGRCRRRRSRPALWRPRGRLGRLGWRGPVGLPPLRTLARHGRRRSSRHSQKRQRATNRAPAESSVITIERDIDHDDWE